MKTLRSFSLVVLTLAAIAAFPAVGHAQAVEGKFTLSHEAHWGAAVLPAGDYEFRLDSTNYSARVLVMKSSGERSALLIPMSMSSGVRVGASQLNLVETGEGTFVSSLCLKDPGVEFYFATPKVTSTQTAVMRPAGMSGAGK